MAPARRATTHRGCGDEEVSILEQYAQDGLFYVAIIDGKVRVCAAGRAPDFGRGRSGRPDGCIHGFYSDLVDCTDVLFVLS